MMEQIKNQEEHMVEIKKYKKYIDGKERTIYKKRGDRKEYIKVKGELKYVKDCKK